MRVMSCVICLLTVACGALRSDPGDNPSVLAVAPRASELPGPAEGATTSLLGVRLDVVLNAWDGPRGALLDEISPVQVTIHNGGLVPLQIDPANFALASTTSERTYSAVPPARLALPVDEATLTTEHVVQRGLRRDVLQRGSRVTGFVFFQKPPSDELGVRLQTPLVEGETGKRVAVLEIPLIVRR
jgi:hypothetical protein